MSGLEANQRSSCERLRHLWFRQFMRDGEDDEDGMFCWVSETQQMGVEEVCLVEAG